MLQKDQYTSQVIMAKAANVIRGRNRIGFRERDMKSTQKSTVHRSALLLRDFKNRATLSKNLGETWLLGKQFTVVGRKTPVLRVRGGMSSIILHFLSFLFDVINYGIAESFVRVSIIRLRTFMATGNPRFSQIMEKGLNVATLCQIPHETLQ